MERPAHTRKRKAPEVSSDEEQCQNCGSLAHATNSQKCKARPRTATVSSSKQSKPSSTKRRSHRSSLDSSLDRTHEQQSTGDESDQIHKGPTSISTNGPLEHARPLDQTTQAASSTSRQATPKKKRPKPKPVMSAEKAARYIGTPQEKAARALARDSSKPWSESDAEEDYDRQPPSVPHSLPKKKKAAASSERNRQHEQQHVGLKKKASFDDVESSPVSSDVEIIEPSKSTTSCSTAQNSKTSAQPEFYSNAAPPSRSPSPVFARARLPTFRKDASTSAPPKIQQRNDTLQPSPLVNGSHHPESTSHSPPVSSFAPPGQDKPTFEVIWVDQSKNKSSKHMIRILATDAQEPDIPPLTNREDLPRFGHISATIALGYETDTHKRWRKELGGELADFLNLDALVGRNQWELEDFPRGYQLVERLEGPAGRPTRTTMLYGSMFANPFLDSKRELLKHLMGLINGGEPCSCQNCATRVETKGAAIVLSPPPEVVPPASKSTVLGEINGPMQKLALQLELRKQGFSWSADKGFHRVENDAPASSKDPAKVNADNAELLKLKRRATAYGGPYVDPHQSEDIERANQNPSSWVRMKELVWYTLPTPIRSRNHSLGGPLFTHWPAVVCERKTLSEPRLVGPVPPMGQPMTSESIQSHQTMEWHVCLLGCSDFRWSTTNGLLPFLAYKPHTESLFQIAPDATSYRRSWNDHDGRPAWPSIASFTDAETAYIAFAIALSHASSIMKKLVLCDPFAHRVRDPDLPESALSAGKHNESIRNWAAPRVAHFQGAFIGAEKIWVGDLIRLRVYKSSKTFLPGEGEQLEPNFFADSAGRDRAKNALASKHKKTSSPNASYLERRCLVVLVSSIWRNPSNDKPFISGYVYEMKKLIHQEKPQHPPSPPDLPPLPTPPPGYCFRLLVPLPAEYSFDMELVAGRLYRSDIRPRQHPEQDSSSEENKDTRNRALALVGRKPGQRLYTPFEGEEVVNRYLSIKQGEVEALNEMKSWWDARYQEK